MGIVGYDDIHEIYRGNRYVVLRASRTSDGVPVAIKTPQAEHPRASRAAARLRQEYDLLSGLRVPGVVKPIELGELAGMPALILEYAGSENLKDWLRGRPFRTEVFLEMAIELAGILARIHENDLVHRDINPFNIIVGADLRPTLVDFDAAAIASGLAPPSGVPGELEGTLPYISPEQTGRMNRLVDHRSDLYALGATYYEMLTGAPPFLAHDPMELVHAHLARTPIPPAEVDVAVPEALSNIVLKLLAKMPEKRYQTAAALLADLEEAERRFQASGTIPLFELDRLDLARDLPLPEKLYGRERETAELEYAVDRVFAGANELLLVIGSTGVGKSELVERLRTGIAERQGRFLSGKFDLRQGNTPYAPLVEALRHLIFTFLEDPEPIKTARREGIRAALGPSGRVLTEVIPELERLIDEQPVVPALGPMETENRFRLLFQAFVRTLATREHPVVLFVDDLQWADAASLSLLGSLATAGDLPYLLLLGASRPVDADHPLRRTLEVSRSVGATIREVELPALDIEAVTALCSDALRCDVGRGRSLAELVLRKTAGNPFFIRKLLRLLQRSGLVVFDATRGTWEWDLARIERVGVTDNVADLLVAALRKLPGQTQDMLRVAACIGNKVPLGLVAAVLGQSLDATARRLWSAIEEGFLLPLDTPEGQAATGPWYRFGHDRVQHAAYSLLGEEERNALHLSIGRRLAEGLDDRELTDRVFEVVDQLNLGEKLVVEESERSRLVDLNSRAAQKARASSAYGAALAYLKRAIAHLPEGTWQSRHELAFVLHRNAMECAFLTGDRVLAEQIFDAAWRQAASALEKADLCDVRLVAYSVQGAYAEAIQWGREGLRLFGVELPASRVADAVLAEVVALQANLQGRSADDLLAAPPMRGLEELACMRILSNLLEPTYVSWQKLFPFVVARMVNLSLVHGNAVPSAAAYVDYAMVLCSVFGDFVAAHAFGRLGVDLSRRFADTVQECRALGLLATFVNIWRVPLRTNMPLLRQALAKGLESGEVLYVNHLGHSIAIQLMYEGEELPRVLTQVEAERALTRKINVQVGLEWHLPYRQAIRCLEGLTRERNSFDDAEFDERAFLASAGRDPYLAFFYEVLRLQTSYLFGDFGQAREMSASAERRLSFGRRYVPLGLPVVEHNFFTSLTLAACCDGSAPTGNQDILSQIEANQRKLGDWADNCAENFRHRHLLVAAEVARLTGRPLEAAALYDEAIEASRRGRFLKDEAIAKELAGRFYRALERKPIAKFYLSAAIEVYARWGARAKVDALQQEFPDLGGFEARSWGGPLASRDEKSGVELDLLGILKAAETISSEVVLDRLLEKLMQVCLATAGAERGALLLEENGALIVRVVGSATEPVSLEHTPVEISDHVPKTVMAHVRTGGDVLVLADAAHQGAFASDPYVMKHVVRSCLALPIRRQAKLVGALYLENNLATSVFAPHRVGVLQALSSQIAISLEVSILFERLTAEGEERKRAEAAVRFLAEAGAVLVESLDYQAMLARVARLAVPTLADWCIVDLVEEGDKIRRVGASHADPAKATLLGALEERYPPDRSSPEPSARVIREEKPLLLAEVSEDALREYGRDPENVRLLQQLGTRTLIAVPLLVRGRILGAICFVSGRGDHRYGARDLALAEELARRAASAIDNAMLYRDAQKAIRLRDEFLSTASHQLRTPLTSLQLVIQSLVRGVRDQRPSVSPRMLTLAEQQTQRLTALINQLLDITRLQTGPMPLTLEDFDLVGETQQVLERMQMQIERAKSPARLHAKETIVGRWDRSRIDQLLTNLFSNALTYGAGHPIDITLERADGDGRVRITVRDRGIGIATDRLPHIFERFERAASVRNYGGLGLGLFIVQQIVDAHRGTVAVESELGGGACFTVELPFNALDGPS